MTIYELYLMLAQICCLKFIISFSELQFYFLLQVFSIFIIKNRLLQ